MPYSIVLTKEGSSQLISVVPSTWVNGNDLFWPRIKKTSELERLRRDENSVPDENWKKLKCIVKVNGICTFTEGLKLEELYSKFEDTEDEERYVKNQETKRRHPTLKSVTDDLLDLNSDFNIINQSKKRTIEENKTMEEKETIDNLEDNITDNYAFENSFFNQNIEASHVTQITTENVTTMNPDSILENENFVTLKLDHLNEIISENSALSTENKILKESMQRFQNLEQDTKRGFAVIQTQLDKIFEFMKYKKNSNYYETITSTESTIDDMITRKIEFPINSIEHLDLLESELINVDFSKALVKKFAKISGSSGTHKLAKIGLTISKSLFTDELLNHFTWKGIKGCSKLPFIPYINIRDCFYKIVHLADNSCTALEADAFLQNSAIKHSGQRIKRKSCEINISKSKKKRTETKKSTDMNNKSEDQEEEKVINTNSETPNSEEEMININTEKQYYIKLSETEHQLNEKKNKIDDDIHMSDTNICPPSKVVTILSDIKIKNKIMDLKHNTKMQNISSDNLHNLKLFEQNAE